MSLNQTIESIYRSHSRRVLATLIRLLGDFDRAEEALHDAFAAAAQQWTAETIPANPYAWLVSAGRFRAIDHIRRRTRFDASRSDIADSLYPQGEAMETSEHEEIEDDMLRLIFTCCHPLVPAEARMAMALREVCGLTTEEIAHAFLTPAPTVAQRIVRAKNRIRAAHIPYEVPGKTELPERLAQVLHVIYLVFNEGYSASSGSAIVRADLAAEAIRLGRLLLQLLPDPEVEGLLAIMLLQDSRRLARTDTSGNLVLLVDQDRALWDRSQIREGLMLSARAMAAESVGSYALQAAIAAEHARAVTADDIDWRQLVMLYDLLLTATPSPVIELNRSVAVSIRDGPAAALSIVDGLLQEERMARYHLTHAAKADFLRQIGRLDEARQSYEIALSLCQQAPEQAFLRKRLAELDEAARR
ncbi:putative RNA polymerase sigma factor protein (sigma-70) Genetic Information Processing [Rhizobium freirei PRF 81]|uniref:Putative RNA polymerase sigma factor protein (Sigma-70) Genetic Information Processing n=1 Tax=Rhizobium freirei PRF 81 TaxID=363754 RepID=N6U0N2_9HYPH|nr:putative RNA polymerase sigma factor protein (sigma-70) Genetic Information Processing [Rhizobium freirei PRF 81]